MVVAGGLKRWKWFSDFVAIIILHSVSSGGAARSIEEGIIIKGSSRENISRVIPGIETERRERLQLMHRDSAWGYGRPFKYRAMSEEIQADKRTSFFRSMPIIDRTRKEKTITLLYIVDRSSLNSHVCNWGYFCFCSLFTCAIVSPPSSQYDIFFSCFVDSSWSRWCDSNIITVYYCGNGRGSYHTTNTTTTTDAEFSFRWLASSLAFNWAGKRGAHRFDYTTQTQARPSLGTTIPHERMTVFTWIWVPPDRTPTTARDGTGETDRV